MTLVIGLDRSSTDAASRAEWGVLHLKPDRVCLQVRLPRLQEGKLAASQRDLDRTVHRLRRAKSEVRERIQCFYASPKFRIVLYADTCNRQANIAECCMLSTKPTHDNIIKGFSYFFKLSASKCISLDWPKTMLDALEVRQPNPSGLSLLEAASDRSLFLFCGFDDRKL